jgi:hypothetical protein
VTVSGIVFVMTKKILEPADPFGPLSTLSERLRI